MKVLEIKEGLDIVYSADIPLSSAGVGLASSSALAVGVLNALCAYKEKHASPEELARFACEIEIERLKNPIGIQDQYAVAYGGFKQYKFWKNGEVSADAIVCSSKTLHKLKKCLMLYFTGLTRVSSDILGEQKDNIYDKSAILDELVDMVEKAYNALRDNRPEMWGEMLDRSWQLKKRMASRISNPLIEEMYGMAKKGGAVGGKILGAGGGGFLLLYVPEERQKKVIDVMKGYKRVDFDFESDGSRIIFMEDNR